MFVIRKTDICTKCTTVMELYRIIMGQTHNMSGTIYVPLSTKPSFALVLFIKPYVLPAVAAFSTGCWGTLMDLVCYWGRRGVLHPRLLNVCVCLCMSIAGHDFCLPYFMLSVVNWSHWVFVWKDPAALRKFDAFNLFFIESLYI